MHIIYIIIKKKYMENSRKSLSALNSERLRNALMYRNITKIMLPAYRYT